MPKEIELRVVEALQNDVGKGIVRIDTQSRNLLEVSVGDVVEIIGKRATVAIVWKAHVEDEGLGIIRMDGTTRYNAKVSIGDRVKVRKANVREARTVILAPSQYLRFSPGFNEFIKKRIIGRPVINGDLLTLGVLGTNLNFTVVKTIPAGPVRITDMTEVIIREQPARARPRVENITYEDIGGLKEELQRIRELVELPLKYPELFEKLGIEPPKGVLLYGPPGCGKTLIAKAIANETNAYFISINGPEIMSKFYGESEENLRKIFKEAEENAPSIIFIDEIDAIAPKRDEVHGEVERRVVAQLLALMDGLKPRGRVVVIAATNRPEALDPALRRPGRFDREIYIKVPDRNGRKEILQIHTRNMPLASDVNLDEIADVTHGFTGADIAALCKEAAMQALRRILPKIDFESETIPPEVLEELKVTREDFLNALKMVEPSAMREVRVEIPNVRWSDIGGLEYVKQELREAIEWPLKYPQYYQKIGIKPPKGILLYGPPGTGKTLLAKAVATESQANFISVKGPEILSKWVGESEKAIREIFRRAKQVAPCVIFFDEIDAIASYRGYETGTRVTERVLNQLLTEMDGIEELHGIVVLAATNRPDLLDPALLRPGRFDKLILVPMPNREERLEIFKVHTRNMPLSEDVDLSKLSELTDGYVGADIEAICREAGLLALREAIMNKISIDKMKVRMDHFELAMKKIKPSIPKETMKFYEMFRKKFEIKEEKLVYTY